MSVSISVPGSARFSVGRVLRDSFGILARNFISFAAIAIAFRLLWLLIPAINSALGDALNEGALDPNNWKSQFVQYLVGLVISGLTQAAIIYGTMQNLRGQSASWSDVGRGLSFAPLIIVAGLFAYLPTILSTVVSGVFADYKVVVGATQIVMGIVGLFLFLIWWVYAPVLLVDGGGILAALRRSAHLTKGRRWKIFGLLMLFGIMVVAPIIAVVMIAGVPATEVLSPGPSTPAGFAGLIILALTTALHAVLATVSYYHLQAEKEGLGVDEAARVFD